MPTPTGFGASPNCCPIASTRGTCTTGRTTLCNPYDIVLCTYVANVLPREERAKLFWDLLSSMRGLHGRAYITVRRDGEGQRYTSTGSFQDYEVDLVQEWNDMGDFVPSVRLVHETSAFAIFELSNYHD